jgi:predicted dehydrogenase
VQQNTVAVIGCGYWGKNLVRNFHHLGALAVVCELTPAGQRTAKELAPQAAVVTSVEAALAAPVAGVVIATPAETHYALVQQALAAGKDVLVEKPLALTYAQGVHLVHLAETTERILMVGHVLEYHPAVRRLEALIQHGVLGKIRYMSSKWAPPECPRCARYVRVSGKRVALSGSGSR